MWQLLMDHAQAILPTVPVSRNTGAIALIIVHTQNLAQTRPDALVVTFRQMPHQIRPDHPQQIVRTRRGAM